MKKQWAIKEKKKMEIEKIVALEELLQFFRAKGMTPEHVQETKEWIQSRTDVSETLLMSRLVEMDELIDDVFEIVDDCYKYLFKYNSLGGSLDRYIDSEPMEFDGDIIITDPCYVSTDLDWCNGFENKLKHCMMRDTIYGDWSCTTFDLNSNKLLGHFCADAGEVGVFDFAEVDKYNPEFKTKYGEWCWTHIKDFKGTCQFIVKKSRYKYHDEWHTDFSVEVHGHGVNKKTGEPIDFVGKQTGF